MADEAPMLDRSAGLARHDLEAVGYLQRVLTLCSIGVAFTGIRSAAAATDKQAAPPSESTAPTNKARVVRMTDI